MPPETPHDAPAPLPALLDAAAAIRRTTPWDEMPDEATDVELSCEALGLDRAVAFMYGVRENFAALLFESLDDYRRWLANAEAEASWDDDAPPPQAPPAPRSLRFVPPAELPAGTVAEAIEHGWDRADDAGCPTLAKLDADGNPVPVTAADVAAFEAVARALDAMLPADDALEEAWAGGAPWSRALTASTCVGELEIAVEVPPVAARFVVDSDTDLRAALAALEDEPAGIDERRLMTLMDELVRRREEATPDEEEPGWRGAWVAMLAEYSSTHLGRTVATLDAGGLEEVLFEIVPRKVTTEPSAATEIVEDVRALYRHLEREWALPQAPACLVLLDDGAAARLEAELANPANWGIAKSMAMRAIESGFDLTTPEGVEAFRRAGGLEALSLDELRDPGGFGDYPFEPPPEPALAPEVRKKREKKRKDKRKAARKARSRNR